MIEIYKGIPTLFFQLTRIHGLCQDEGVDFLAPGLNQEERPGFFARGSHTRENDKPRERVFILSYMDPARVQGLFVGAVNKTRLRSYIRPQ